MLNTQARFDARRQDPTSEQLTTIRKMIKTQYIPCTLGIMTLLVTQSHALTWALNGGSGSWPADKRSAIVASMNEAVAIYNANGHFNKHLTVNYNPSVPTANGSFSGWIEFGGSISTRTALHEIGHTLGVGTGPGWTNGGWWGPAANARVKLYNGANATIGTGSGHFWPYGLNYANEDTSVVARERHCKMVSALRRDMGLVKDSDNDGMPDDWETFNFGTLGQSASGDPDGDGISNVDEYATDSNPNVSGAISGRTYRLRVESSGKIATIDGSSTSNGGDVVQAGLSEALEQRWTAIHTGGGWWKFVNVNSGKVLETAGMSTADGANVVQWEWLNNFGQQWRLAHHGGNYWRICNRQSGKALDVANSSSSDGANIQQWTDVRNPNQRWALDETIPFAANSVYSLSASHSGKVLEIIPPFLANGAGAAQYDWNGGAWQKWRIEDAGGGFVRLLNVNSGKLLEVANASTANGASVQQWSLNGHPCQEWKVVGQDTPGVFSVFNRNSGLALDVFGVSTANGAQVDQWQWHGADNQQWRFDPR